MRSEFGISQPAVSQRLKVLCDEGFATVRPQGPRRIYALDPAGLDAAEAGPARLRAPVAQRLDLVGSARRRQLGAAGSARRRLGAL